MSNWQAVVSCTACGLYSVYNVNSSRYGVLYELEVCVQYMRVHCAQFCGV